MSSSVAGVVTVGTSGVLMELGNWEITTLEACLNEGLKGNSLEAGKPIEIISNEETERVALSGEVALLDEVALPERGTLSEETMGVNMDG